MDTLKLFNDNGVWIVSTEDDKGKGTVKFASKDWYQAKRVYDEMKLMAILNPTGKEGRL